MENPDQEFEQKLGDLCDAFQSKVDTMLRYTSEVVQICSASLAASNVRHIPITKRIKSWESAKGSIRRRHHERVLQRRLRDAVKAKGRRWKEYCHDVGLDLQDGDTKPFRTTAEMLAALQDFGGVRISLYFPGDVERVAAILKDHLQVVKRTDKNRGSGSKMRRMQELINYLQDPAPDKKNAHGAASITDPVQGGLARTFSGYRATHFIVKLRDEDIPLDRKYAWRDVVVEIQVGTLVMHVWSEIEHDMIYKPLVSQGGKVSDDEERLLDLINGIVLTGEAALQQLEASTAKRLDQRAKDKGAMASSYFELATWIEKDCEALRIPLAGTEWRFLEQLYAVLKAIDMHKHSKVTELLRDAAASLRPSRQTVPLDMLGALCRRYQRRPQLEQSIGDTFGSIVMTFVQKARYWALRLVQSLNMAIYLDINEMFTLSRHQHSGLSLVSILRILHPDWPSYVSVESVGAIGDFCRAWVESASNLSPTGSLSVVDVAKRLATTKAVVSMSDSVALVVPAMICQVFPVSIEDVHRNHSKKYIGEPEMNRILDFIEFYVSRANNDADVHFDIWDRLTARFGTTADRRFFVPRLSPGEQGAGLWQLTERPTQLDVMKIDLEEASEFSEQARWLASDGEEGLSDDILQLAYTLFPAEQREIVRKAWNMARTLRPERRPPHLPSRLPFHPFPPEDPFLPEADIDSGGVQIAQNQGRGDWPTHQLRGEASAPVPGRGDGVLSEFRGFKRWVIASSEDQVRKLGWESTPTGT